MKLPPLIGRPTRYSPDMRGFIFTVPLRTKNPLNGTPEHWGAKSRRVNAEKTVIALAFPRWAKGVMKAGKWERCIVHFIRFGPRRMDDDGCTASLKGVRDEVAKQLGIDDGDERIAWTYEQQTSKDYAVAVQVERVEVKP